MFMLFALVTKNSYNNNKNSRKTPLDWKRIKVTSFLANGIFIFHIQKSKFLQLRNETKRKTENSNKPPSHFLVCFFLICAQSNKNKKTSFLLVFVVVVERLKVVSRREWLFLMRTFKRKEILVSGQVLNKNIYSNSFIELNNSSKINENKIDCDKEIWWLSQKISLFEAWIRVFWDIMRRGSRGELFEK